MRQGYRVIDIDTHVNPCVEVLLKGADKDMRDRMDDLKPYLRVVTPRPGQGDAEDREEFSIISIAPVRYQRVAGAKPPTDVDNSGTHNLAGRTHMANRSPIAVGAAEDNATGRLQDMDVEGRDIDFIIPGPWAYGAPAMDLGLEKGLYRSYHQYMADYCSADSRRLKSMVLVPGRDPEWAAQVIRDHIKEDWAAAVWPLLPTDMPIDDPDLEPIWKASNEGNFPIMYHGFHIEPPYFPGYRDIWDNPAMGRCAGTDLGRPAVPLLHADGRHAGPLSQPASRHHGMWSRLAASVATASYEADRLRPWVRVARPEIQPYGVHRAGPRLLQRRLVRGR